MGRRSFGLSTTQINRMVSSCRAAAQRREREELINCQQGISTERRPTYSISNFDFNNESRMTHVEFLESKQYRKIDKYVTQNGVRYPIYSGWKTKTKSIKKTLKLTNEALEKLKNTDDELISLFSYEIVSRIGNEDLYPSWFIIDTLVKNKIAESEAIKKEEKEKTSRIDKTISKLNADIRDVEIEKSGRSNFLSGLQEKKNKKEISLGKAKNTKNEVLYSILSFGIYLIFHSKKRIASLEEKISLLSADISKSQNKILACESKIAEMRSEISDCEKNIAKIKEKQTRRLIALEAVYKDKINEVEPLPTIVSASSDTGFIPLKKLTGMNYEKIVGCYVIHNTENDKYYVGQSKDVLKRVCKQHFDGTKVKNIIFAEDYFTSKIDNRDDLFEIKIIRLKTKDELDRTEKELIEEYDSFNSGYNGTGGNS